jgi:hypothetical protein
MEASSKLTPVREERFLIRDVGYCATLGKSCYLMLTRKWFGWLPSELPMNLGFFYGFSLPKEVYSIPIDEIALVEFRVDDTYSYGMMFIHRRGTPENSQESILQFQIKFTGFWIRAFSNTNVPITLPPDYYTLSARLRQFQWYILYGFSFFLFVMINVLARIFDNANAKTYLGLSFLAFLLPNVVLLCRLAIRNWPTKER